MQRAITGAGRQADRQAGGSWYVLGGSQPLRCRSACLSVSAAGGKIPFDFPRFQCGGERRAGKGAGRPTNLTLTSSARLLSNLRLKTVGRKKNMENRTSSCRVLALLRL